jgi:hypothetical protein
MQSKQQQVHSSQLRQNRQKPMDRILDNIKPTLVFSSPQYSCKSVLLKVGVPPASLFAKMYECSWQQITAGFTLTTSSRQHDGGSQKDKGKFALGKRLRLHTGESPAGRPLSTNKHSTSQPAAHKTPRLCGLAFAENES